MNVLKPYILGIALAALAPLLASGASKIVRTIDEPIDFSDVDKVEVSTQGGSIKVSTLPGSMGNVTVEQVFRNASESEADSMESKIDHSIEIRENVLYVYFKYKNEQSVWSFFTREPTVNFNISISCPPELDVDLDTSGGQIEVKGVRGEVAAETSGGAMHFADIGGAIKAHTSGGQIRASEVEGQVDLSTSGGPITVSSIGGNSTLKTSGGPIKAMNVRGPLDAKTSGGSITASFPNGIDSDTRLKTSGGSITAKLPEGERFFLDAQTSGGSVRTQFPFATQDGPIRNRAEGPINGGGPELELKSSGGNIQVNYL